MAKKLKEFKIRRKGWLRGKDCEVREVSLRTNTGSMCCLGFFARHCGVPAVGIEGAALPSDIPKECEGQDLLPPEIFDLENDIANVNDKEDLTPTEREKTLTKLFKKVGYKPIFV